MSKTKTAPAAPLFLQFWTKINSYALLGLLTVACLLPFSGRAFHVDDPLFVWAAKQIVKTPTNPYGFDVIWDYTRVHMSDVTQNPPLASYYTAAIGSLAGFAERPLHLGFLVMALTLVVGVYQLAETFTKYPLLAALATLVTPGLLVSASSVMCDTMMLALWIWAMVFWIGGLEPERPGFLALAGVLASAAFLTKYFAASLIALLFVYSVARVRRMGTWALYLLIPVATMLAYQHWSAGLYGQGLMMRAGVFAHGMRSYIDSSGSARAVMALGFTGGCAMAPLWFAPLMWSKRKMLVALAVSALISATMLMGWFRLGRMIGGDGGIGVWRQRGILLGVQWALFLAGGLAVLALVGGDLWLQWKTREQTKVDGADSREALASSLLLAMWVLGTFAFAGFVNWTVNARSVLPLIPAVAILLTRQCERRLELETRNGLGVVALALLASAAVSLWITTADTELANAGRKSAFLVYQKTQGQGRLWFEGHWGFQYYLEQLGAEPLDLKNPQAEAGDLIAIPFNNVWTTEKPPYVVRSEEEIFLPMHVGASTISWPLGAAFYSSYWGPMPFAIGPEPIEGARILHVGEKTAAK